MCVGGGGVDVYVCGRGCGLFDVSLTAIPNLHVNCKRKELESKQVVTKFVPFEKMIEKYNRVPAHFQLHFSEISVCENFNRHTLDS